MFIERHDKQLAGVKNLSVFIPLQIPPSIEDDSPYFVQLCWGAAGEGSPSCANFKSSSNMIKPQSLTYNRQGQAYLIFQTHPHPTECFWHL